MLPFQSGLPFSQVCLSVRLTFQSGLPSGASHLGAREAGPYAAKRGGEQAKLVSLPFSIYFLYWSDCMGEQAKLVSPTILRKFACLHAVPQCGHPHIFFSLNFFDFFFGRGSPLFG